MKKFNDVIKYKLITYGTFIIPIILMAVIIICTIVKFN